MLPLLLRTDENRFQLTGDSVKKTAVAFDVSHPILRIQVRGNLGHPYFMGLTSFENLTIKLFEHTP